MKKSTSRLIWAILWAVDAVIAIVRFFDIRIVVENKKGQIIKAFSRAGDAPTPRRLAIAALPLLMSNLNMAQFFKARKREQLEAASEQ